MRYVGANSARASPRGPGAGPHVTPALETMRRRGLAQGRSGGRNQERWVLYRFILKVVPLQLSSVERVERNPVFEELVIPC